MVALTIFAETILAEANIVKAWSQKMNPLSGSRGLAASAAARE
jgi:hypothetical protein